MQKPGEIPLEDRPSDLGSRFVGRATVALVLMTLTIGLVLVVASLSWWDLYVGSPWNQMERHYLGNGCVDGGGCWDYTDSETLRSFFPPTYGLVLTALALSVFELAFLVLATFERRFRVGILVTGILGSVTLLVAPIYFYFARISYSQGFLKSGFSGSYTERGTPYIWGGGTGWFMAPFVAIFFLVATIVVFFVAPHIKPLGSERVSSS